MQWMRLCLQAPKLRLQLKTDLTKLTIGFLRIEIPPEQWYRFLGKGEILPAYVTDCYAEVLDNLEDSLEEAVEEALDQCQ